MTLELFRQIFEKYANIKFHGNPSNDIGVVPCLLTDRGQTDMKKLIVIFRNFANAPKNHKTRNSLQDFFFLCQWMPVGYRHFEATLCLRV